MAERHVVEAEGRITRHERIIKELRARGHDAEQAERVLVTYQDFLWLTCQRKLPHFGDTS